MEYREIELTLQQAKDLKIQGRIIKLLWNYTLLNTKDGWKIVKL